MHEVSFQDKEKEHLTRLQDAEEMKVCARPLPQSPACIWTAFSYSRKICLLQRLVWPCRREGLVPAVAHCGLAQDREEGGGVQKSGSHAALVCADSLFLGKGRQQPPRSLCGPHCCAELPEHVFP